MFLAVSFFLIAFLYSSVGFGGGSSYLALLALVLSSFFVIRSTALICNLLVVSGSTYLYYKAGHFKGKAFLPFILSSIPLAFLGAIYKLEEQVFFRILGIALILAAVALIWQTVQLGNTLKLVRYPKWISYLIGGAVGFLSGLVGIGGGIFLAPILNYLKWEQPLKIAALASFFILVNSLAGIIGLLVSNTFTVSWVELSTLAVAVVLGGQLGVRLALFKVSPKAIRILTALLVFFVGVRVLLIHGLEINLFT